MRKLEEYVVFQTLFYDAYRATIQFIGKVKKNITYGSTKRIKSDNFFEAKFVSILKVFVVRLYFESIFDFKSRLNLTLANVCLNNCQKERKKKRKISLKIISIRTE